LGLYYLEKGLSKINKYKDEWWYSTTTIFILTVFGILIVPFILAIVLLVIQIQKRNEFNKKIQENELLNMPIKEKEAKLVGLNESLVSSQKLIDENNTVINNQESFIQSLRNVFDEEINKERETILIKAKEEAEEIVHDSTKSIADIVEKVTEYQSSVEILTKERTDLEKEVQRYKNQARKFKSDLLGLKNFNERFPHTINFDSVYHQLEQMNKELDEKRLLGTVIRLHLHSDNSRELRKLSNATNKEIQNILSKYEDRYTTKGNKTIYNLMVIALQAEIQILLLQLKFNKLDDSINAVKDIITKLICFKFKARKNNQLIHYNRSIKIR